MIFRALYPDDRMASQIIKELEQERWAAMEPGLQVFMSKLRRLSERFSGITGAEQLTTALETALERAELADTDV